MTLNNNAGIEELTIDCDDPKFANNANCLTYTYGDGETFKATDYGSSLAIIIIGSIIALILIGWVIYTLFQCHRKA